VPEPEVDPAELWNAVHAAGLGVVTQHTAFVVPVMVEDKDVPVSHVIVALLPPHLVMSSLQHAVAHEVADPEHSSVALVVSIIMEVPHEVTLSAHVALAEQQSATLVAFT